MLTRRVAITVCALCLASPAAAGASEGTNPPNGNPLEGTPSTLKAKGPYGSRLGGQRSTPYGGNPAAGAPSTVKVKGPSGIPPTGPPSTVKAKGPYGIPPTGPPSTVKAKGPYGVPPTGLPSTTAASIHGRSAPLRDDTNGWRTAAISEAGLLAAFLLGWALLLPARRRAAHMVT
jgi:hypothetical protein